MHSQKTRETPLQPWVIAESSGGLITSHCNCMAGLGETCTHVGAILFAVEFYVRQCEQKQLLKRKPIGLYLQLKKYHIQLLIK